MAPSDRRRYERYVVKTPVGARVGAINAVVMDASDRGLGIQHDGKLPNIGSTCRVIMESAMGPITVDCQVVHTRADVDNEPGRKHGFLSGLRVIAADLQSEQRYRQLMRSLMGQRAGAVDRT